MNIFFLDWDVRKCAQYHNDKHVVKMVLETAQLLCGSHWATGSEAPYKLSHKNHPCAIWVRSSLSNYLYLCELGLELCREYSHRYNKTHKTQSIIEWCLINKPTIPEIGFTTPPTAMPDEYKNGDVIKSYRNYYHGAKKDFCKWTNRNTPKWYNPDIYGKTQL